MSREIITPGTRAAFREALTNWTLSDINAMFKAAGLKLGEAESSYGVRRELVDAYYRMVTWSDWNEVRRILSFYEHVLSLASSPTRFGHPSIVDDLLKHLRGDGFRWIRGRIIGGTGLPAIQDLQAAVSSDNSEHLLEQIERIQQSVEKDPALAVGTAKELVETCCKTILAERGKPTTGKEDIPTLTKQTFKELKLIPEGIDNAAKGAEPIKRLLSNLATISQSLAQLRGLYGTGHGKHSKTQAIKPRHAKLAVGAAASLVTFLFETHKQSRP